MASPPPAAPEMQLVRDDDRRRVDPRWRRRWNLFLTEVRRVDGPFAAWRFLRWFAGAARSRCSLRFRRARFVPSARSAEVPIAALGPRARALFPAGIAPKLTVADTAAEAERVDGPVVVLQESSPSLSVPAVDPAEHNPVGWSRRSECTVGTLGPLADLPAGVHADCVVSEDDLDRIASLHHLEDVEAFHPDALARAAALVRLATHGTVIRLADGAPHLRELLGAELHGLLSEASPVTDAGAREALSIRIRRAALRDHSRSARMRQLCEAAGIGGPSPPLVSVLLVTKRPALLGHALAGVARQTWPRIELVLGLHGDGFAGVEERLAELVLPATVVRIRVEEPLGVALNRVAAATRGDLVTKMDDDDAYGREHLWDLVLAQEYSGADLVAKSAEFVYLAESRLTVQHLRGGSEEYDERGAGGTILMSREALDRVGGFPAVPRFVDRYLYERVARRGARAYRTHGAGFVLVRHGSGHTWDDAGDEWFLDRAYRVWEGWDPERCGIEDMDPRWLPGPFVERAS